MFLFLFTQVRNESERMRGVVRFSVSWRLLTPTGRRSESRAAAPRLASTDPLGRRDNKRALFLFDLSVYRHAIDAESNCLTRVETLNGLDLVSMNGNLVGICCNKSRAKKDTLCYCYRCGK